MLAKQAALEPRRKQAEKVWQSLRKEPGSGEDPPAPPEGEPTGTLLKIKLLKATQLAAGVGAMNPFVVFHAGSNTEKSEVKPNAANPDWSADGQEFELMVGPNDKLVCGVWNDFGIGGKSQLIGEALLPVGALLGSEDGTVSPGVQHLPPSTYIFTLRKGAKLGARLHLELEYDGPPPDDSSNEPARELTWPEKLMADHSRHFTCSPCTVQCNVCEFTTLVPGYEMHRKKCLAKTLGVRKAEDPNLSMAMAGRMQYPESAAMLDRTNRREHGKTPNDSAWTGSGGDPGGSGHTRGRGGGSGLRRTKQQQKEWERDQRRKDRRTSGGGSTSSKSRRRKRTEWKGPGVGTGAVDGWTEPPTGEVASVRDRLRRKQRRAQGAWDAVRYTQAHAQAEKVLAGRVEGAAAGGGAGAEPEPLINKEADWLRAVAADPWWKETVWDEMYAGGGAGGAGGDGGGEGGGEGGDGEGGGDKGGDMAPVYQRLVRDPADLATFFATDADAKQKGVPIARELMRLVDGPSEIDDGPEMETAVGASVPWSQTGRGATQYAGQRPVLGSIVEVQYKGIANVGGGEAQLKGMVVHVGEAEGGEGLAYGVKFERVSWRDWRKQRMREAFMRTDSSKIDRRAIAHSHAAIVAQKAGISAACGGEEKGSQEEERDEEGDEGKKEEEKEAKEGEGGKEDEGKKEEEKEGGEAKEGDGEEDKEGEGKEGEGKEGEGEAAVAEEEATEAAEEIPAEEKAALAAAAASSVMASLGFTLKEAAVEGAKAAARAIASGEGGGEGEELASLKTCAMLAGKQVQRLILETDIYKAKLRLGSVTGAGYGGGVGSLDEKEKVKVVWHVAEGAGAAVMALVADHHGDLTALEEQAAGEGDGDGKPASPWPTVAGEQAKAAAAESAAVVGLTADTDLVVGRAAAEAAAAAVVMMPSTCAPSKVALKKKKKSTGGEGGGEGGDGGGDPLGVLGWAIQAGAAAAGACSGDEQVTKGIAMEAARRAVRAAGGNKTQMRAAANAAAVALSAAGKDGGDGGDGGDGEGDDGGDGESDTNGDPLSGLGWLVHEAYANGNRHPFARGAGSGGSAAVGNGGMVAVERGMDPFILEHHKHRACNPCSITCPGCEKGVLLPGRHYHFAKCFPLQRELKRRLAFESGDDGLTMTMDLAGHMQYPEATKDLERFKRNTNEGRAWQQRLKAIRWELLEAAQGGSGSLPEWQQRLAQQSKEAMTGGPNSDQSAAGDGAVQGKLQPCPYCAQILGYTNGLHWHYKKCVVFTALRKEAEDVSMSMRQAVHMQYPYSDSLLAGRWEPWAEIDKLIAERSGGDGGGGGGGEGENEGIGRNQWKAFEHGFAYNRLPVARANKRAQNKRLRRRTQRLTDPALEAKWHPKEGPRAHLTCNPCTQRCFDCGAEVLVPSGETDGLDFHRAKCAAKIAGRAAVDDPNRLAHAATSHQYPASARMLDADKALPIGRVVERMQDANIRAVMQAKRRMRGTPGEGQKE
jgi:hypothetical protein